MKINNPSDVLSYMDNIEYGWIGADDKKRIDTMKDFRKLYRTMPLDQVISRKVGTCIEQVYLMKVLLEKIKIKSKMYCARMYEDENFNDLDAKERMHCFLLFFIDNKVFQIEHPDPDRRGIHEYEDEKTAVKYIVNIYENMMKDEYEEENIPAPEGGFKRKVTEFYEVKSGLSYKDFNLYINKLDK